MSKVIKLKRGLDIRIKGEAAKVLEIAHTSGKIALKPGDFPGLTPKLAVKAEQEVKAGEALFFDKYHPEILFTSPVSGKVTAINRGERRKILEIVVETDGKYESLDFIKAAPKSLSREQITDQLLKAGLWPYIKQRPYGIIANPSATPRDIFISCFDSAPLAPDYEFIMKGQEKTFQTGIDALAQLTNGKVFLGLNGKVENSVFDSIKGVETNRFIGPHPAGNVGIQIHHISPINKGDIVWTIHVQDVLFIGRLFETGKVDFSKIVALTGSETQKPQYYKTISGAEIATIIKGKTAKKHKERIIGGNVLTGTTIEEDGYLGYYDQTVTVIPEGDYYEFAGWAMPRLNKFSASRSYLSWLMPKKVYTPDTNLNGEERAYVMTGQYEKVLPMDILPVHLMKSIIADDIDKMEKLGIYEVIEEDMALCEYVCTSKIEVQSILRKGFNLMIRELS